MDNGIKENSMERVSMHCLMDSIKLIPYLFILSSLEFGRMAKESNG